MKQFFFCMVLFGYLSAAAQVGIGNTDPKASLDITATNTATPSNIDGILIPRIDDFPATNPTADQDGMLVFLTGNGIPNKGFYYWDINTTSWINAIGAKEIDDLLDGKSDNDGSQDGSSIFLGLNAGLNDDSSNNFNVGIGFQNMTDNSTGAANSSIGYQSLSNNTSGNNNSAVGYRSLFNNTTGNSNIALGIHSLFTNTSGDTNVALGNSVLYLNTTGYGNFGTGNSALFNNTTGRGNYALGYRSLYTNTTANSNVGLGDNTLYFNTVGHTNLALGYYALNRNTIGDYNVGLGTNAGFSNTTGNNNVYLGKDSGYNHIGSNTLWIENTDADEDNALIYGEFGTTSTTTGNILRTNSEFQIGNPTNTGYAFPTTDGTNGQVLSTDGTGNISFVNASSLIIDTNTQNTLDQAYNEGGAAAGRTITADNGAVIVNGTFGSGNNIDDEITGVGTRMFFNPNKAAFRAGYVNNTNLWNNANIGDWSVALGHSTTASGSPSIASGFGTVASGHYSSAFGRGTQASGIYSTAFSRNTIASGSYSTVFGEETTASGSHSTAFGEDTTASGSHSTVFGLYNTAPSHLEMVIGYYATTYTPISSTTSNVNDRVFSIGNGILTSRSNALTIYKSGLMNINDEYNMPLIDGINGQVMTTDGSGNVTFQNATINTDNQQIDTFNFNSSSNILSLEMEDDGQVAQTVNLSSLQDGTGTDDQTLSLSGTVLSIESGNNVNLNTIDTDNQQIDNFAFNSSTNILSLEMEDDGQVSQTVDLSTLNPLKAVAHITLNADQVTTGSGTTKVDFDTVDFDIGSNFNTTTDVFTVPTDGIYRVSAQIVISSTTSTGSFDIRIRVNGSQVRIAGFNHSGSGSIIRQINSLLDLTAGQTIDISFQRATGVTVNSNSSRSFFDIEQL